ncbi:serine/threonine-protein kinase ATR-like isoform X2 [Zophobas morio]|uniref:serine/threonine-protein kinase ATR-like isoform X2 n=1 Tax=Zophobas morio TaxID=2755281 RepID=UPI003083D38A
MSILEEIPAFSIWETFHQTIPALMSTKTSERSAEHLAKIIKSGDFTNIFVYSRDPSMSFEAYQTVANKYKSFTTWFLGQFFYLLSCKGLSKSHGVYVDIQLCVLEQLSHTQLNVYDELAKEYSKAFNNVTRFIKCGDESLTLEVFIPVKFHDVCEKLNLDPISVEITKDYESFLLNFLKIINYIVNHNFDFRCFDADTRRNLDNLLFLISECRCVVKIEILKIYVEMVKKIDCNVDTDVLILRKVDLFAQYFEQIVYNMYNKRFAPTPKDVEVFEILLLEFLEMNTDKERFMKISEFLLITRFEKPPTQKVLNFCKKKRDRPLYSPEDFDSYIRNALTGYDTSALCGLRQYIISDINTFRATREGVHELKLYNFSSGKWKTVYFMIIQAIDNTNCVNNCKILSFVEFMIELTALLIEIRIEFNSFKIVFIEENVVFVKIFSLLNRHFADCTNNIDFTAIFNLLLNLSFCSSKLTTFFDCFAYPFTSSLTDNGYVASDDYRQYMKELSDFCHNSSRFLTQKELAFEYLNKLLEGASSGLFDLPPIHDMEITYMKIAKQSKSQLAITNLPHLLTVFNNSDRIISEILNPALASSDEATLRDVTKVLPQIICVASSDFIKLVQIDPDLRKLKVEILCDKCHLEIQPKSSDKHKKIDELRRKHTNSLATSFTKVDVDLSALTSSILKSVLKFLTLDDTELKVVALEALPYCSSHILKFYSGTVANIWVEKCGDSDESVRRKCGEVSAKIVTLSQQNKVLSNSTKNEIVDTLFDALMKQTKKSLQESDFKLQETILDTILQLSGVKCDNTVLPIIKILIYLIMVPTSKHSLVAVNRFLNFAKSRDYTANQLYKLYKREICEVVAHLCVVNQTLINYSLATSLCKISATFEFYNVKDFVSRECHQLLPFFVSKVIKSPVVGKLMDEMALMVSMGLPELLTNIYGNIFLHVFLNEPKDEFKQCSKYLETTTGLSSTQLRKRNLWVILNELLLNFHEKRDKVLMALQYLAKEDTNTENVQEYLQSRLLGLLQHFDFKLMGKNTNRKGPILLSLADFFKYMGPSHIGPLRFKIIAMLQTADCGGFPDLTCEVWSAFIKSCDVESLAPQLATIFVSILPLIKSCPRQINDIFKYLVIQNENLTKDYIKDLFFVDELKVDALVLQTIRRYVRPFDDYPLKDKMKIFLKYLSHETSEVRIRSLKQLKLLMEKNREELDRMILGYNGIDPVIVELIEILTLGCREKDPSLKLACGEVMGELGAVEPSHLPRRYAQNSRNFSFFMTDDGFIVNSLNELTKALQGEKNTVSMDRFAVAIQEILKNYEISSDATSTRNDLWKQFPESQQALMLPLLTSRYIVSQPQEVTVATPIYGSADGASFQTWLYNWTRSLIATLPQDNQVVLHPCLPAMKQDSRILMVFLPYIVLHSVISDVKDNREKMYTEIKTVTSSFDKKRQLQDVESLTLPSGSTPERAPERVERTQCTKVVFIILDFLNRWTREWQWRTGSKGRNDPNFVKIKTFLERFCKLELAKCNFQCGEYPRALMYLEDYISEKPHEVSNQLIFLTKIYAQLDEPDGVAGVTALQPTEPPIEQRILSLEVSGKLSDAAACYERLPQPFKMHHLSGLIQCYLDLDNVNTALNFAQGALARQPEFGNMLLEMQAEPLWRLGRYDDLNTLLERPELVDNTSWGVQIGKALLSFQNRDRGLFDGLIQSLKNQQADLLGAASVEEGAYQHGYCYISRLHALNELQQVERATYEILKGGDAVRVIKNLAKEWELRIKVVQESVRIVEPLMCLRRVAVEQSKRIIEERVPGGVPLLNSLLGECWLYSAQTARLAGVHQQSYTYTLKAEEFAPPSLFVEKSKLHWLREEHEQALTTLRRGLEILLPDSSKEAIAALPLEKRKICAEAKLLIATYNDTVSNVDTDIKTANYREATEVYKEWETGLVSLAQFFDRRFQNYSDEDRDSRGSDMQIWMISYFCKSLRYGTAFVYQSLPRLLSIWFDYGTRLLDVTDPQTRDERKTNLIKMTKLIDVALETLPVYVFLTAFSQIISRICHPQKEVYVELKSIIIKLLLNYPQQSLWMIISVIKSSYMVRSKRCADIISDPKLKTIAKLVKDFTSLAEKLIELCNKDVAQDVETTTVSVLLRTLPRMLNKTDFSEIMIPTHKFRKLVLPNPDFANGEHNPFPNHYVHIVGIAEEVTILRSLQRPRKITFRGSDGKGYVQMLKPKDDLRKDFRLMEFNDIVNQLLSRESESRQRRLNIRLYSVSPLNEECGLIEWIPNLLGLRPILTEIYKQKGQGMTMKEIRDGSCNIRDPLAKKREIFKKVFLARVGSSPELRIFAPLRLFPWWATF